MSVSEERRRQRMPARFKAVTAQERCVPSQVSYLTDRLGAAAKVRRAAMSPDGYNKRTMPSHIRHYLRETKRMGKAVDAWRESLRKKAERAYSKVRVQQDKVREAILFGTPDMALKAVKRFEAGR